MIGGLDVQLAMALSSEKTREKVVAMSTPLCINIVLPTLLGGSLPFFGCRNNMVNAYTSIPAAEQWRLTQRRG